MPNVCNKQSGFTLVELITVMVIVSIISAIALPRLFSRDLFDSRGFYDQLISTLRYAQKTAIAQRRLVCVTFPTSSRVVLSTASAFGGVCDTTLQSPDGQASYAIENVNGVTLGGAADFNFDALGRPSFAGAAPLAITVSGYPTGNVCVAAETGYVYGRLPC